MGRCYAEMARMAEARGREEKTEEMHQQKEEQMIKSAEGSAGLLHYITKPTPWRRGAQILEKEKRMRGC